ncbi:beta-N-acetylhexosaminidase [Pseudolysinimonas sp.]|jgi:beta-N-acetylhexosaminidase|uniref:beta-N-acetylhexosaminidase n=1 Tax=Pseudolysinimonas sp. TaxID=2680009 RepID=UPI003783E16E
MSVDAVLLPGFVGTTLPAWVAERLRGGLAGVCLYGENVESLAQLHTLVGQIRQARPDALIAIDEEGGDVTRLHYLDGSPYPGAALLGRIDDVELTAVVGRAVANDLAAIGVDLNLAPVADVNSDPRNPVIGVRSFGADPELAARHIAAFTAAHESAGVATSVKHFPGHGDTAADSHLALPVVDVPLDVLRARDLPPFRAAIEAGARTVMTSHILLPQVDPDGPATFSSRILGDLLRGELGFDGVIVSDALDMAGASGEIGIPAAAAKALAAGCDLLCLGTGGTPEQLDAIADAVRAVDPVRLGDAVARVGALVESLRAGPAPRESWGISTDDLADAFAVVDGAVPAPDAMLVVVETIANIAVGLAPWGPAAAGATVVRLNAGDPLPPGLAPDAPIVLVAKDVHRHREVAALAELVRATRPGSLIVDMGWPSGSVDVATYGASRGVGIALLHWLRARGWRG